MLVSCRLVWNRERQRDLHTKKPLVEGSGKEGIQQVLMDKSQAEDTPTEAKPRHSTKNTGEYRHQDQNWKNRPHKTEDAADGDIVHDNK